MRRAGHSRPGRLLARWFLLGALAVLAVIELTRTHDVAGVGRIPLPQQDGVPSTPVANSGPALAVQIDSTDSKYIPLDQIPAGAQVVTVGIYISNVYDMDVNSNTFYLSGYVWLRWHGDLDPVGSLEFSNAVDGWGLMVVPLLDPPRILEDGSSYQVLQIQGRFYQPFDLRDYPLDKQKLVVTVENTDSTADEVMYVPDAEATAFDANLLVPGWKVNGLSAQTYVHDYGTNFGEVGDSAASRYSSLMFALQLERLGNMFIWKLLLTLLVVLITNWLALLLNPTWVEVRTAMPATALLTLVFLQQGALEAIPEVSSLVLMDKLYVLAYICVVITFLQILWVNANVDEEDPASVARMKVIDIRSLIVQVILFAAILFILIWITVSPNSLALHL